MRETILKKMATSMRYAWVALAMTTLAACDKDEGPVVIESGSVVFDATNSVTIKNNFECQLGATLTIK